jgi:hypothetical protein
MSSNRKATTQSTVVSSDKDDSRTTYKGLISLVVDTKDVHSEVDVKCTKLDIISALSILDKEIKARYPGAKLSDVKTVDFVKEPVREYDFHGLTIFASVAMRWNQCPICGSTNGRITCPKCSVDPYDALIVAEAEAAEAEAKAKAKAEAAKAKASK